MPMGGLSGKLHWDDFDHEEYAHMLTAAVGTPVNRVQVGDRLRAGLPKDEEGNP
jgi:hypothetical protein